MFYILIIYPLSVPHVCRSRCVFCSLPCASSDKKGMVFGMNHRNSWSQMAMVNEIKGEGGGLWLPSNLLIAFSLRNGWSFCTIPAFDEFNLQFLHKEPQHTPPPPLKENVVFKRFSAAEMEKGGGLKMKGFTRWWIGRIWFSLLKKKMRWRWTRWLRKVPFPTNDIWRRLGELTLQQKSSHLPVTDLNFSSKSCGT